MLNNKACALFRAANIETLDYPFDAALASAMAICDEAVIVVGQSQDNTLEWVCDLAADYGARVKIVRDTFTFDLDWQERWWDLAASHTDADWLLWLDADEVIDPQYAPYLRNLMAMPASPSLIRFPFIHFYATDSYHVDFPLKANTRLGRRSAGFRMRNLRNDSNPAGAACAVVVMENGKEVNAHSRQSPFLHDVTFPILHYGWCRTPAALALSQRKQAAWYKDGDGLQDGSMPLVKPYDYNLARMLDVGRVTRWQGEHPPISNRWRQRHSWQWRQLEHRTEIEVAA